MANFRRYFFIMPTLARFEREIHERVARGEGLTAELLCDRMADLFAEGYGPDVEVDRDARRDHLGRVRPSLRAVLRLPVRDRDLGRPRARARGARRRRRCRRAVPRVPLRRRARSTRSTRSSAPASTCARPSPSSRRSPCSPRSSTGSRRSSRWRSSSFRSRPPTIRRSAPPRPRSSRTGLADDARPAGNTSAWRRAGVHEAVEAGVAAREHATAAAQAQRARRVPGPRRPDGAASV